MSQNSKFETIWQYDIEPKLQNLEAYRQKRKKIVDIWSVIGLTALIICGISGISLAFLKENSDIAPFIFIVVFASVMIMALAGYIVTKTSNKFRQNLKSVVLVPVLASFGDFQVCEKDILSLKKIKKLKLYPKARKKKDDDRIAGIYKNFPVVLLETLLYHTKGYGKHSYDVTDFEGLILKIGYNMYGDSKKILNDNFMEKFKQFKFDFSFSDIKYAFDNGFLYLFIERPEYCRCGYGFFEVGDVKSTLFNKEIFQKNYNELTALFSLIDELIQTN